MAILMPALPFMAFLGLLAALGVALVAYFWPTVEWWLLCWLQRRRRDREAKHLHPSRLGLRWPR